MFRNSPFHRPIAFAVLLLIVSSNCGCGAHHQPTPTTELNRSDDKVDRKVVFKSEVELVVEDLTSAQKSLSDLLRSIELSGGYLAHQDVYASVGLSRRGSWTVRVPVSNYEGFVQSIEKLGEIRRNTRESQDVTDAYVDLEARLRTTQSSEKRLLDHLEKTGTLKDTLEIERELTRVRTDVERLQGQLNVLKNKVEFTTVVISMMERHRELALVPLPFGGEIARTFNNSLHNVIVAVRYLVLILVALAPWALVSIPAGATYYALTRWLRRRRKGLQRA